MQILQVRTLISSGSFPQQDVFSQITREIEAGIKKIVWPPNTSSFTLNPTKHGNGVKPIKIALIEHLESLGWISEYRMNLGSRLKPGPIDIVKKIEHRWFALEWETGNISSSHRALNKMALGLINGLLAGAVLVLPSRNMYPYLTDRVGNFPEIEPYFPVWERIELQNGFLGVIEIEHDDLSPSVPLFQKGTDGWAMYQGQ